MNILFNKIKSKKYISLLIIFIISIGITSIPVNANDLSATNVTDPIVDVIDINDVEYPIMTIPRSFIYANPGDDYLISITAEDNKGIQDVTAIHYVNYKRSEHKMTKNPTNGRYEYTLPGDQISKYDPFLKFYFIATDLSGLKTVANTTKIYISNNPNRATVTPSNFYDDPLTFGYLPHQIFACPEGFTPPQNNDIHIVNPTEYPIIYYPTHPYHAWPRHDYYLKIYAEDNKDIQNVIVDYNIGDKAFSGLQMNKTLAPGQYLYIIPGDQISLTDSTIKFTVTATNNDGLKTITDDSTIIPILTKDPTRTADDFKMSIFAHTDNNRTPNLDTFSQLPDDSLTIKEILSLNSGTNNVTVAGQIVYFATDYSNPVIQSVIDGNTYSLYIKGSLADSVKIGDLITVTGTYYIENGFPMLKEITDRKIIGYAPPATPEVVTIEDLKKNGLNMLSRFVKIKDVTLGTYEAFGSTEIKDETGNMSIYKASPYPSFIKSGEKIDLYATIACSGPTIQLYTGTKEANHYNVYKNTTDTEPPLITFPYNFKDAQLERDYYIYITADDNDSIQEVTITYTINGKTISDKKMVKDNFDSRYSYMISSDHFSEATPNLTVTFTATDMLGLKTVTKPFTININNHLDPIINSVRPIQDYIMSFNEKLPMFVSYENAGKAPLVTYTLKNDNETIFIDKKMTVLNNSAFDNPNLPVKGNYTAIVNVKRSEDGKTASFEWHFKILD